MIYLDSAATSPLLPCVKDAMLEIFDQEVRAELGNASSLYSAGVKAKNLIEEAREKVARLLDVKPREILFTSGGSESNNTVIKTFENKNIAASAIEHPSVLRPAEAYAKTLVKIPVDEKGIIDLSFLKNLLENPENSAKKPNLISVMLANNELGILEPITEVRNLLERGDKMTKIHTDATKRSGKFSSLQRLSASII